MCYFLTPAARIDVLPPQAQKAKIPVLRVSLYPDKIVAFSKRKRMHTTSNDDAFVFRAGGVPAQISNT